MRARSALHGEPDTDSCLSAERPRPSARSGPQERPPLMARSPDLRPVMARARFHTMPVPGRHLRHRISPPPSRPWPPPCWARGRLDGGSVVGRSPPGYARGPRQLARRQAGSGRLGVRGVASNFMAALVSRAEGARGQPGPTRSRLRIRVTVYLGGVMALAASLLCRRQVPMRALRRRLPAWPCLRPARARLADTLSDPGSAGGLVHGVWSSSRRIRGPGDTARTHPARRP